ncbi:EAL domain-containing protein [Anaerotignum sp.]|uniref:EAL domain-containing protein n=1 Tax=Anaerotignum sp. TaxID=2039241 RepID=UPI0027151761|nr:EAL domain-containing protein [Anaerotignum sp.]
MPSFTGFFEFLSRLNDKIISKPLLRAVRNGFTFMMPFVLLGSFALVIMSLPIQSYQQFMLNMFGTNWKNVFEYIRDGTYNSFSLIAVISISYSYAQEMNDYRDYVSPIIAAMTSLASFTALYGITKPEFLIVNFGVFGVFSALMVAILSSILFREFSSVKRFKIRLGTDGANPGFNLALSLFLPSGITIAIFACTNKIFSYFFDITDLQIFISGKLSILFMNIHSDFFRGVLFILLTHVLWLLGIHGSNMLEPVAQGIFVPVLDNNLELMNLGIYPSEIFSKTFCDTFVLMGGCGTMLCLVLAILLVGKNKSQQQLSKFSLIPVLFNINELMVFGIPIVFNPIFVIPFLGVPLFMMIFSLFIIKIGLVPLAIYHVEWTTPVFLSGYISTGSIRGSLLQLFNLCVGTICYVPFVKLWEKAYQSQRDGNLKKVLDAFKISEDRGVMSSLLSRYDDVGSIARALEADLEDDLRNNKLNLYYQPIVDCQGNVVCMEALLRWKHNSYGFIYPPLMIALAEEAIIMTKLGDWIIDTACRDLDTLKKKGFRNIYVCVNISTSQLEDKGFVDVLRKALKQYHLAPGELEIEITERLALEVNRKIKGLLDAFNVLGIKLSMDDFGMGHSSLMYLKEYNFDTVKLDGSLVKEILNNKNCQNIVSSIISLGQTLNYTVLAEYVETKEQMDLLRDLGCELFQGYLFNKAIPLDEAMEYIKSKQ